MSNEAKRPLPLKATAPTAKEPEVPKSEHVAGEHKAFSVERCAGGWCFVTVTYTEDGKCTVEKSLPDLKPIAIERFKITALKHWTSQ